MALTLTLGDEEAQPPTAAAPPEDVAAPAEPALAAAPEDVVALDEHGAVARVMAVVRLEAPWAGWLAARASAYGEPIGAHAAALLRAYWAHHDDWRHTQLSPGAAMRRGAP